MKKTIDKQDVLTLVLKKQSNPEHIKKMQVLLKTNLKSINHLRIFLKDFGEKYQIQKNILSEIDLALGELVLNIIKYNPPEKEESDIHLKGKKGNNKITFILKDKGKAFNPLEYKAKKLAKNIEDQPVGGLGIQIAKKLMDDLSYERKNNTNILTLIKYTKSL